MPSVRLPVPLPRARLGLPRTAVRFAAVGLVNTVIDVVLFWVLNAPLGILAANFVSTSAGMVFSFLAHGRHTFGAGGPTVRQAVLFVATNGVTMWLLQPWLIHTAYDVSPSPLILDKVLALGATVVANFLLYRYVVWGVACGGRFPPSAGGCSAVWTVVGGRPQGKCGGTLVSPTRDCGPTDHQPHRRRRKGFRRRRKSMPQAKTKPSLRGGLGAVREGARR